MKELNRINLVQFFLYDIAQIELVGQTAILGANGVGKSTIQDAVQLVITGAHGGKTKFNAQGSSRKSTRSLKDYCLGVLRPDDEEQQISGQKRDDATTYITLGFADKNTGYKMTAGLVIESSRNKDKAAVVMRFVVPGVALSAGDCIEEINGQQYPLSPADFEARLRQLAEAAGRTPEISKETANIKAYLGNLYDELSPPGAKMDPEKFLKAFSKSLELRDIESVDEYVRQHIVDTGKINIEAFGRQIRHFNQLQSDIERTREQVEELRQIGVIYTRADKALSRQASLAALVAVYDLEAHSETLDALQDKRDAEQENFEKTTRSGKAYKAKWEEIKRELHSVNERILRDPSLAKSENLKKRLDELEKLVQDQSALVNSPLADLLMGAHHLSRLERAPDVVAQAIAEIEASRDALIHADIIELSGAIETVLPWLSKGAAHLDTEYQSAQSAAQAAGLRFIEERDRVAHLEKGGANLQRNTLLALSAFKQVGIKGRPICELIDVTDPQWRPAIEAYLGNQLEELLVTPGRENEAVALIRQSKGERTIYNRKVVQPRHVEKFRGKTPTADEVASLVRSDDPTALAFVYQAMAGLRFATSEADLSQHAKALTQDGMVSGGGGTNRKKLSHRRRVGMGDTREQLAEAQQAKAQASKQASQAQAQVSDLGKSLRRIEQFADASSVQRAVRDPLEGLSKTVQARKLALDDFEGVADENGQELIEKARTLSEKEAQASKVHGDGQRLLGQLENKVQAYDDDIEDAKKNREALNDACKQAQAAPGYQSETMDAQREEIDELKSEPQACSLLAKERAGEQRRRHEKAVSTAGQRLALFSHDNNLKLHTQVDQWKIGQDWVAGEIERLESTALLEYEEQAKQALDAAQNVFKSEIAYNLRESMTKMESHIRTLNKVLKQSPEFSNGERYRFKVQSKPEHSALRNFIEYAGKGENDNQFAIDLSSNDSDVGEALEALKELASDPSLADGKIPSVLTDYREFYTFDLEILVDGRVVDTLSRRTTIASGGEHRTPFYVIAGASLASAYRLDSPRGNEGAGLMLLDEAFHNIDSQNTHAAATFLTGLGLQLVMAAPESEEAKLTPFTDTLYNIGRYDMDPWLDVIKIKPATHALMVSDDPRIHTELVQQELAEAGE